MNTKTLQLLSQKHPAVEVVLFTENGHGKRGFLAFFLWNKDVAEQNNGTEDSKDNQEKHLKIIVAFYREIDKGLVESLVFYAN